MKLLVDECCSPAIAECLKQDGHDVVYVATEMPSVADVDILIRSILEQRIIVTEDRDFCELIFRDKKPTYGIILIRIHPTNRHEKVNRLRQLFSIHSGDLVNAMTTLTLNNIRISSLTGTTDNS